VRFKETVARNSNIFPQRDYLQYSFYYFKELI